MFQVVSELTQLEAGLDSSEGLNTTEVDNKARSGRHGHRQGEYFDNNLEEKRYE